MNIYLYLNLATFQYIDGFGCYNFFLNRIGLELIIFFLNFFATFASVLRLQITVTFGWILGLQVTVDGRLTVDCSHRHAGSHLLQAQCCVALIQPKKVKPTILCTIAIEITHLTSFALLLLLRILRYT